MTEAKKELDRLAYSRKDEIDPYDYENFLRGIRELTKTEREIFDWYVAGKTAKVRILSVRQQATLSILSHDPQF